jgi:hypothetical protein
MGFGALSSVHIVLRRRHLEIDVSDNVGKHAVRCRNNSRFFTSHIRWKTSSVDCNKPHVNRSRTDRVIDEIRM